MWSLSTQYNDTLYFVHSYLECELYIRQLILSVDSIKDMLVSAYTVKADMQKELFNVLQAPLL